MVDIYVPLVQTYSGRDKVIRMAGYVSVLLSSVTKGQTAAKFTTISKQMSSTRVVLRLCDDIPMWTSTRQWNASDKDRISRYCGNIANVATQIFFPCEHIYWLAEHKIIPVQSQNWSYASTVCWAISLFFSIIRCLRRIYLLRREAIELLRQRKLESPDESSEAGDLYRASIDRCSQQMNTELLNLIKNLSDFMLAINILPWKFLWAGKFSPRGNAIFGSISSLIGIYMLIPQRKDKKA